MRRNLSATKRRATAGGRALSQRARTFTYGPLHRRRDHVVALAAAFLGYFYLTHLDRRRRLEIVHEKRLAAMEKGIPLPEQPGQAS